MTRTLRFTSALALLTACCMTYPLHAATSTDAVLLVDQTSGVAGVQRNGKRLPLNAGDTLQEQDTLVTATNGRITLRLGRHGFVEVGPDSEVGVERLPFAAYARDLKSIFSVGKGYFRVVWKHPQISTSWPLYIYMAGHRISLVSGEYFFQNYGQQEQRACVAAGQLALQAAGSDSAETIKAPSCTRIVTGAAPETTARNPDDWIAVRRAYSIEATAMAMLEPANSVAAPAAPTPPRRVINTAAMPSFSTAEPVAIPAANEPAAPALSALPDYRNEPPAIHTPGPGPVVAAPVLPPPLAPRTGMVASTVLVEEPLLAISPPLAAPTARAAPIIASPVTPPVPPLPSVGPSRQMPTATAPASAATAAGSWALNIASYPESAVAVQQTQKLQNAGYTGVMSPAMVNGRTWYRVQIVGFANEPAARGAANELRDKLGLKGIWVMRLP